MGRSKFRTSGLPVDQFGVGDAVSVFYVSELGAPCRVSGVCVNKRPSSGRFGVITASSVVYSFWYKSRNVVAIKRLGRGRRTPSPFGGLGY